MQRKNVDWVVMGGKPGELGFCKRCGEGLTIGLPAAFEVIIAASNAFVKVHAKCEPGEHIEKPAQTPHEWFASRDTGTSSKTIWSVMTGIPVDWVSHPHDPADFGRCYRLLKLFPAWRKRLSEVATKYPGAWTKLIAHWDELTSLYEEELPLNKAPRTYERMRELIAAGEKEAARV